MYLLPDLKFQRRLIRWSKYFAWTIAIIGIAVLVGWQFSIDLLNRPRPDLGAMSQVAAILFILTGLSFLLLTEKNSSKKKQLFGRIFAGLIVLISGMKFFSLLGSPDFKIDNILYYQKIGGAYQHVSARMAPATAGCFIIIGISLLALNRKTSWRQLAVQYLAVIVHLIAILSIFGYLYHVKSFYGIRNYSPMAPYTAICFIFISLGVLFANPFRGIMKIFTSTHTGSIIARSMIPAATLIPIIFGLLRLYGAWEDLYNYEFGVAIFAFSIVLFFLGVVSYNTRLLNRRDLQKIQTEKALKESEKNLKRFNETLEQRVKEKTAEITGIFERITDAFIVLDKNFCYTYANKKTGQMINRDPASLIGKCVWDIFPDAVGTETYNVFQKAMTEQCYIVNTDYYEPLDLWQENHIYPSPEGLSIFIRDISKRKRAEQEVKERAIQLHTISNSLPGIMTYQLLREPDGTKRFTYLSESVEKLTGKPCEEVIKDPQILYDLIHEDDRYKITKAEDRSYQTMSILDLIVRSRNLSGGIKWLHIRSVPRKIADDIVIWDGVYIDITESMEREKQLTEKETQLMLFVENSPAAIAMLDKDMKYIIASRRWSVDYNLENRNIIGKSHYEIFPEISQQWKDIHQRCLAGAIEKNEEDLFIRADGHQDWVRWEIHPWYMISGEVGGIILLTEVITEKKKAEELLKHSYEDIRRLASHLERIREEERISMAREIHDELGQQLTVLKMDISWINKNIMPVEEKGKQKITDLLQMIDLTIKTVRRISSELRPSVLDDLGLIAALEWLSCDFEKRSGIKTKFVADTSDLNLDANTSTALFRIFQESLTNIARHAQASEVYASLKKENDKLLISIKDNGKGFVISSIANKKTLGILGMKERVALLNGEYEIISSPGHGSTVKVSVPVSSITEPKTSQ